MRFNLKNLGITYDNIVNEASNNMGLQSPSDRLNLGQLGHDELQTTDLLTAVRCQEMPNSKLQIRNEFKIQHRTDRLSAVG